MQKKAILLVNSSQVLMDITRKILERAEFTVRCAVGVAGAREQLLDYLPDIIIVDNDLPDGSGLKLCRTLCAEYTIPIMLVSYRREDELPALQSGACDFLKKPYDYEILIARINILLSANNYPMEKTDNGNTTDTSTEAAIASPYNKKNRTYLTETADTQTQNSEAAVEYELKVSQRAKYRKATVMHRIPYVAAAVIVAVVALLVGIYISIRSSLNLTDIPDSNVPLSEDTTKHEEYTAPKRFDSMLL